MKSFLINPRVSFVGVLSSALVFWFTFASLVAAHEVLPAIADVTHEGEQVKFDVRLNLETLVAGIDVSEIADTDDAPEAADYDALRAMEPAALEDAFRAYWPQMVAGMRIMADGVQVAPELTQVTVAPLGDIDLPRQSEIAFVAAIPADSETISFGWDRAFGDIAIRQMGVDLPFDALLQGGGRIKAARQRLAVFLFILDRNARDPGFNRGPRHIGRHKADQARIKRRRDDVIAAKA